MNRGLMRRALREMGFTTLLLATVVLAIEAALAYVLPNFASQFSREWLQVEFARGIMQAMLGTDIADRISPQLFQSIAWVHPVVLALVWGHALVCCTRVPAGEVDGGTADIILGLPVSRWDLFFSETVIWMACGGFLLAAAMAGNLLGGQGLPADLRLNAAHLLPVVSNLFCLYWAVGGLAWLVSSLSQRRGRAMTAVFIILLALFLLNYLAPFWRPLERIAFLSPLHYHKPVPILRDSGWPWKDMGVLLAAGGVLWLSGGWVFAKRDLCTV